MDINEFYRYANQRKCPICNGNNLSSFKNKNGVTIYWCNNCGGVPSLCGWTLFISTTNNIDYYSNGDCSYCGTSRALANDHAYLSKW